MSLTIVAFPEIAATELGWVEGLRQAHLPAPEADIAPHMTLVFSADVATDDNLTMHMLGVAGSTQPFDATFRIVAPVVDPINGGWTVQLLPDQGLSKLMRLHNFLYSGPFADHLNLDVPYVPHLTLARTTTGQQAKALCEELNSDIIEVDMRFTTVDLLRVDGGKVTKESVHELEG
ncbi:MAG: 2'-5' RNA ligase family protein [Proteobacteria bacterium]|nr:2'-5' RNA ligase family protein [Pseudomonadota bacterium]MDA1310533.1 2'-5' RNA ligase family protein [Pseudomonadota bacterium]